MTDHDRITDALLDEMNAHGGVQDFCEKLVAFPKQYAQDLAHTAMVEVAKIIEEKKDGGFATQAPPSGLDSTSPDGASVEFECPINSPNCQSNCGSYGCGN